MLERNWKFLTLGSYTALAFYALAIITLAPDLIFILTERDTTPAVWTGLQLWVILLGIIGRLILQPAEGAVRRRLAVLAIAVVTVCFAGMAMAQTTERQTMRVLEPLVIKWEGQHLCKDGSGNHCAYRDIVGVVTACYGETKGVLMGQMFTERQCRAMLRDRLTDDFRDGLHKYFTAETRAQRLTPQRDAAYVSLAYNVGIRGAGRSTATRRLNAGNIVGGCKAMGWWNKAGGRVVRGLVNRRAEEVSLCLQGT